MELRFLPKFARNAVDGLHISYVGTPAFPVLLPVRPPGRYSTTATSSISTIASGWARRLIVVLVGVATPG